MNPTGSSPGIDGSELETDVGIEVRSEIDVGIEVDYESEVGNEVPTQS